MGLSEVRALLEAITPFTLSKSPEKPAPAHVINGYVAAGLGVSSRDGAIRQLITPGASLPKGFSFLDTANWNKDDIRTNEFRKSLSIIFNPDGRVWASFGSPVPIHAHLVTSDPSDERLGPLTWALVSRYAPSDYPQRLRELLLPEQASDPVTSCAQIVTANASFDERRTISIADTCWFGTSGTPAGHALAETLSAFVVRLTLPISNAQRLIHVRQLARGVYFASLLALLLGPSAANRQGSITSIDEIGTLIAWADTPPGPPDHPMVQASERSFQIAVERNLASLRESLARVLATQPLSSKLPPNQRRGAALRSLLLATKSLSPDEVTKLISTLCQDARVPIDGDDPSEMEWISRVMDSAYRPDFVTKGFRSMGVKAGFIGPDRGAGAPRFLCETPLLGTIVAGLCPPNGIDFEGFVDLARTRLGIIYGPGTQSDIVEKLGVWESVGIGRKLLVQNQEALRHRMIRAGLAREYSDGHTEVVYNA